MTKKGPGVFSLLDRLGLQLEIARPELRTHNLATH